MPRKCLFCLKTILCKLQQQSWKLVIQIPQVQVAIFFVLLMGDFVQATITNSYMHYREHYTQQKFVSHCSGSWGSQAREPAWLGTAEGLCRTADGHLLTVLSRDRKRGRELPRVSISALITFRRAPPLWPNYLPKVSHPKTVTLGSEFQHMNWKERDTNSDHNGGRACKANREPY